MVGVMTELLLLHKKLAIVQLTWPSAVERKRQLKKWHALTFPH